MKSARVSPHTGSQLRDLELLGSTELGVVTWALVLKQTHRPGGGGVSSVMLYFVEILLEKKNFNKKTLIKLPGVYVKNRNCVGS